MNHKPIFDAVRPMLKRRNGESFERHEIVALDRAIELAQGNEPERPAWPAWIAWPAAIIRFATSRES